MKSLLFIFILALFQVSNAVADSNCREIENDCEYYSCVSESRHCRNSSYLIRFGRKYCLRYDNRRPSFSLNGRIWIDNVRGCLIRHMNTYPETMSCKEFKNVAFKDHVPCYLESGFCELSKSDRLEILKTIWTSLGNFQILSNGFKVIQSCSSKN